MKGADETWGSSFAIAQAEEEPAEKAHRLRKKKKKDPADSIQCLNPAVPEASSALELLS